MVKSFYKPLIFNSFLTKPKKKKKTLVLRFKATMALVGRFEVKFAFFFLGLALFSCGGHGATAFDVAKYGAKADGQTECAQVSF